MTQLFPKLIECQHFHYQCVHFSKLRIDFIEQSIESNLIRCLISIDELNEWTISRSLEEFARLDQLLHCCLFSRDFSQLQWNAINSGGGASSQCRQYIARLNRLLSNELFAHFGLNCVLVLNWFECDNSGRHVICEESEVNRRGIGAAFVVKEYTVHHGGTIKRGKKEEESSRKVFLSLEIGELVSILEMNIALIETTTNTRGRLWSKGKKGFEVGFFPSECVQMIEKSEINSSFLIKNNSLLQTNNSGHQSNQTPNAKPWHYNKPTIDALNTVGEQFRTSIIGKQRTPLVLRKHARNGKIAAFFHKLVSHERHERNALKLRGILRERVFGCDLSEHLYHHHNHHGDNTEATSSSSSHVPRVLTVCAHFIEQYGLCDGIYRLSGVASNIAKLRQLFDAELVPDLAGDAAIAQDIHCVASLVKLFFRELPNPLLTFQLYDAFVACIRAHAHNQLQQIRRLVRCLPPPHFRTLRALMAHLSRVAKASHLTGMTPKNLAIVWAPNLLRSRDIEEQSIVGDLAALQVIGIQAVLTEYMIENCEQIFFCDKDDTTTTVTTDGTTTACDEEEEVKQKNETKSREMNFIKQNDVNDDHNCRAHQKSFCRRLSERVRTKEVETNSNSKYLLCSSVKNRSNSFESFFFKRSQKKLNFEKIETLFDLTQITPQFESCDQNVSLFMNTSIHCNRLEAIRTNEENALNCNQSMIIRLFDKSLIRNDCITVLSTATMTTANTTTTTTTTTTGDDRRERIERIKAERRQQLRQQYDRKRAPPTPAPRKSVLPSKLRQIGPKVDTRRPPTTPTPTPRRRHSCDVIQSVRTTNASTAPTTTTTPIITITTLKTSSRSKRTNWNTSTAHVFEHF